MPTRNRRLAALGAAGVLATATAGAAAGAGPPPRPTATAATTTCTTYFVASVRRGPHAGHDYAGVLVARGDAAGGFTGGAFHPLAGGGVAAVTGSTTRTGGVRLSVRTPVGVLSGTGSIRGSVGHCVGTMQGRLRGPGRADRGSWLATTGQTIALPGGAYLATSAETANHPNPQVVYKIPASGATSVFAGALNTAGNIDGQRLAARMNRPSGLGYDADRSLVYIADVSNASIRRLDMYSGQVTTVLRTSDVVAAAHAAGYPAVSGWEPQGVAVVSGGGGAILIADVRNYVLWRFNPATSQLKLYAGLPGASGHADGSDTAVRFSAPQQIAISSDGLVGVAEPTNSRVRLRDPGTGAWSTIGVS